MSAVQPLGRTDPQYGRFISALQEAGLLTDDLDGAGRFFMIPSDADADAFGGLEGRGWTSSSARSWCRGRIAAAAWADGW